MSEFIQLFRTFIYRDMAFILGGSIVICSIAYALPDRIGDQSLRDLPSVFYVIIAGMAYIIGYTVQDMGAILGIARTGHHFVPGRFDKCLYYRFTNHEWDLDLHPHKKAIADEIHMHRLDIPPATLKALERIISLQVIGICVGGCSLLSALILFGCWVSNYSAIAETAVLKIAIMLFLLGLSLICLGRIKAMQQMQFYEAIRAVDYPMRDTASHNAED